MNKKMSFTLMAVLVLVLFTAVAVYAGGGAEQAAAMDQVAGVEYSADGKFPAEPVILGFVNYDTSAEQVIKLQEYFEYLQGALNFEIIWSESISSPEQEAAFIEQCAAAGAKGIIGYYNIARAESVRLAASLGMYYWGGAEEEDIYDPMASNPFYLGGYYTGNAQYDFGVAIANSLIDAGSRKIIVMSGGKDYGVSFFVDRYNGIMDTIKAAQDKGIDVEVVYEVPGWPGTEEFAAHQTAALSTDADGLAGTLTSLMWLQPMQNAGKMGQIKIAAIESVSEDMLGLMQGGIYSGICSEITGVFGMAIPMLINAVEGHAIRNPDGTAPKILSVNWYITNPDDMAFYAMTEQPGGGWTFNINDLQNLMVAFNPDVTPEDYMALYQAVSVAEIKARHAQ